MASPRSSPPTGAQVVPQMESSSSTGLPSPHELIREHLKSLEGSRVQRPTYHALGTFSSARDVLYQQRRSASSAGSVKAEIAAMAQDRQSSAQADKLSKGKLAKPIAKHGRARARRTSDASAASYASSISQYAYTGGSALDMATGTAERNALGSKNWRSKPSPSIKTDVYAIGDENEVDDDLVTTVTVNKPSERLKKQAAANKQLTLPAKSKSRSRKVRTKDDETSSKAPSKAARKLSSTQVINSDSPELGMSPPRMKKLSCTQVLNSDDVEPDPSHAAEVTVSKNAITKKPRQSLDVTMQSWEQDKLARKEHRIKKGTRTASGVKSTNARKSKKLSDQALSATEPLIDGPETSGYFIFSANPSLTTAQKICRRELDVQGFGFCEEREDSVTDLLPVQTTDRRRDWTPVKDTTIDLQPAQKHQASNANANASEDEALPTPDLKAVLEGFNYHHNAISPPGRVDCCEPATKRRRIDLSGQKIRVAKASKGKGKSVASKSRNTKAGAAEPKPRKVKAAAKKAQTITALATAAYLPIANQPEEEMVQQTVSTYFEPQIGEGPSVEVQQKHPEVEEAVKNPVNIAKGEKPNTQAKKTKKAARSAKPKKPKVKLDQPDPNRILHSPEKANETIVAQGFLFGTSSQLAIDDSPTFIRQCQEAIRASEKCPTIAEQSPRSNTQLQGTTLFQPSPGLARSKMRVPTAPHGTSLSCGQADRELWCAATRDHSAGLLVDHDDHQTVVSACDGAEELVHVANRSKAGINVGDDNQQRDESFSCQDDVAGLPAIEERRELQQALDVLEEPLASAARMTEDEIIDLCDTSSMTRSPGRRSQMGEAADPYYRSDMDDEACRPLSRSVTPEKDHDWIFIGSDEAAPPVPVCSLPAEDRPRPAATRSWHPKSPNMPRFALQPLNANAAIGVYPLEPKSITRHVRQFCSSPQSRAKKKSSVADRSTIQSSPAKRKRGRPRKDEHIPKCNLKALPASNGTRATPKKKRPLPATGSNIFVDIDDISDVEEQATPSPPRRQASCPSPPMEPLPLTLLNSEPAKNQETLVPTASRIALKADEPQWPSILRVLFPQISAKIKALSPSNDIAELNWHEKILLYDPIVIEDLTAWLNEQGVRCEVLRAKPKPKKKAGRPKKDAGNDAALEAQDAGVGGRNGSDVEVCQEELKPWMVQKWCEEMSVCCYSRDGIKSGWNARHKSY